MTKCLNITRFAIPRSIFKLSNIAHAYNTLFYSRIKYYNATHTRISVRMINSKKDYGAYIKSSRLQKHFSLIYPMSKVRFVTFAFRRQYFLYADDKKCYLYIMWVFGWRKNIASVAWNICVWRKTLCLCEMIVWMLPVGLYCHWIEMI